MGEVIIQTVIADVIIIAVIVKTRMAVIVEVKTVTITTVVNQVQDVEWLFNNQKDPQNHIIMILAGMISVRNLRISGFLIVILPFAEVKKR